MPHGDVATRVWYYKTHQKWLLEECTPFCVLFEGLVSTPAGVEPEGVLVQLQQHGFSSGSLIENTLCYLCVFGFFSSAGSPGLCSRVLFSLEWAVFE